MKPVRLSPEAEVEVTDAYFFYESRVDGLGEDLHVELDAQLERIARNPAAYERVPRIAARLGARRAPMARFPYSIVFVELPGEVRVLAFAPQRRRPRYWLRRLK